MTMESLGTVLFEISNMLLLITWLSIAFCLWRVREHKILKGGEFVVIATLLSYAALRFGNMLGYRAWDLPSVLAVVSSLTILSGVIIVNLLREIGQRKPVKGPVLTIEVNGPVAKTYAEIVKAKEESSG